MPKPFNYPPGVNCHRCVVLFLYSTLSAFWWLFDQPKLVTNSNNTDVKKIVIVFIIIVVRLARLRHVCFRPYDTNSS